MPGFLSVSVLSRKLRCLTLTKHNPNITLTCAQLLGVPGREGVTTLPSPCCEVRLPTLDRLPLALPRLLPVASGVRDLRTDCMATLKRRLAGGRPPVRGDELSSVCRGAGNRATM